MAGDANTPASEGLAVSHADGSGATPEEGGSMDRIINLYATQVRVLWDWRGGRVAMVKRLLIALIVATVAFLLTALIMGSRMNVDRVIDGVIAVILIALFNALIRPVVLALAAPISLILVAVLVLVLQVVAFLVVANFA